MENVCVFPHAVAEKKKYQQQQHIIIYLYKIWWESHSENRFMISCNKTTQMQCNVPKKNHTEFSVLTMDHRTRVVSSMIKIAWNSSSWIKLWLVSRYGFLHGNKGKYSSELIRMLAKKANRKINKYNQTDKNAAYHVLSGIPPNWCVLFRCVHECMCLYWMYIWCDVLHCVSTQIEINLSIVTALGDFNIYYFRS